MIRFLLLALLAILALNPSCGRTPRALPNTTGVVSVAVGGDVPSFMPWHVTGPHAGKTVCPLCVYGGRPSAAIWTTPAGLSRVVSVAADLDRAIDTIPTGEAVGYVVLLPAEGATRQESETALLRAFANTPLKHVFLTVAETTENAEDLLKYAPSASSTIDATTIYYVNRTAASLHHTRRDSPQQHSDHGAELRSLASAQTGADAGSDPGDAASLLAVPMCPDNEPGEPLELTGTVYDEHGKPLPKASIIAYNTDATGHYVPRGSSSRSPRLRAVAITDDHGRYRFRTIRPGPYPGTGDPSHIHLHIDAAVHAHTYRTIWFDDDPLVTPAKRRALDAETVIVPISKSPGGIWTTRLDIHLEGS